MVRPANPEALEWPSPILAGFGQYEATFRELQRHDEEAATRWRVAMLKAEWCLSDGYFEEHDKWARRAHRIEAQVLAAHGD